MLLTFNAGSSNTGLTGTIGFTLYNAEGTLYAARTTAGITEAPAGSGSYHVVLSDTLAGKEIVWTLSVGGNGAGEAMGLAVDAFVSSRMATFTYTAPPTASGIRTALGMATGNLDTQLGGILAAVEAGAGTGARTVTITVTDGADPVESAKVRMTMGADTFIASTGVSGIASFSLDDGTYVVAITRSGRQFMPTTLVVSKDTDHTYVMTQVTIPPSNPTLVTGYLYCYDKNGVLEAGVEIDLQLMVTASGTGVSNNTQIKTATSSISGLVSFVNLFPGATYWIRRGEDQAWTTFTVPSTATDPYALPNIAGEEP
jgi:hypothetical protein